MYMEYRVVEKFISINGEGQRAGELSAFIRFAGCNLRCNYCDTAWALSHKVGETETTEDIIGFIRESGVRDVTLTGGEPLDRPGIAELIARLLIQDADDDSRCLRVEIETNGAVPVEETREAVRRILGEVSHETSATVEEIMNRLSMTLDYKCPGSGCESAMLMENYECVEPQDTVKFVVSDTADLDRMREIVERYKLTEKCTVYVSAVFGRITPADIVDYMKQYCMNDVRLQLQIHKYIWDPQLRGV